MLAVDICGKQDQTAQELGPSVIPFHADVRQEAEVEAIYAACLDVFGGLDASIRVAGTQATRQQAEFTLDEFEEMTATNLRALLLCCNYASRLLEETGGGSIVKFTSVYITGAVIPVDGGWSARLALSGREDVGWIRRTRSR